MIRTLLIPALVLISLIASSPAIAGPCDQARTTKEMVQCLEQQLNAKSAELRELESRVRDKLDERETSLLEAASGAWEAYRQAECKAASGLYAGGSMAPVVHLSCELQMTTERTERLTHTYDTRLK